MEELDTKLRNLSRFSPIEPFKPGQSFGERALLEKQFRAGTVITLTDCYFAVVTRQSYDKLMKKSNTLKKLEDIAFLSQIKFLNGWLRKEKENMWYLLKQRKVAQRGTYLLREGEPSKKMIIILSGEVEIVKTNLSQVFFNS